MIWNWAKLPRYTWKMQYLSAKDDEDGLKQVILTYCSPYKLKQIRKMKKIYALTSLSAKT